MVKKLAVILCLSLMLAAFGCTDKEKTEPNTPKEPQANTIMGEFKAFSEKDSNIEGMFGFIKDNISKVSKEDASRMVDQIEKLQKKNLPQFETIFNKEGLQKKFNDEYPSILAQKETKDPELKELVAKTKNSGYKVETAEGFYFPIIDYRSYTSFRSYVTADMKDYIDIMTKESDKVPVKDAALMIGWDEVITRALSQERFINTHPDSIRINEIKMLYKNYVTYVFYGQNNTPIFRYDSNTLDPEVKKVYEKAVADTGNSVFLKELAGFINVVRENNYKLTPEVGKYREKVIERLIRP